VAPEYTIILKIRINNCPSGNSFPRLIHFPFDLTKEINNFFLHIKMVNYISFAASTNQP
jgi:hypothetical protein